MPTPFPRTAYCPVFQSSLELLGSRWTAAILRVLFDGPMRFTEILETVPRLSSRLLAQRLEELAEVALVERQGEQSHRVYALTDKGHDLRAVFQELERWNQRWATSQ